MLGPFEDDKMSEAIEELESFEGKTGRVESTGKFESTEELGPSDDGPSEEINGHVGLEKVGSIDRL